MVYVTASIVDEHLCEVVSPRCHRGYAMSLIELPFKEVISHSS
jgi:hypothetical protein